MTENQCGLTAAGKKINKRMCKLLSNRGPSSGYKMRHKKKLLSVIFLQALDSWQSGQSQPYLTGLVCLFHNTFCFLAHPDREDETQTSCTPLPFLCEAEPGMSDRGWERPCCRSLMLQFDLVIPPAPLLSTACVWNSKMGKLSSTASSSWGHGGEGGVLGVALWSGGGVRACAELESYAKADG